MNLIGNKYSIEGLEDIVANNEIKDIDWYHISKYQKLTESFIEKYKDKLDWYNISVYQELTESFIDKYADKVYWFIIISYHKLTHEFLEKHLYKYNLFFAGNNNCINKEHIFKLQDKYKDKYYIDKLTFEIN